MFTPKFFAKLLFTKSLFAGVGGATILLLIGCGGSTPTCGATGLNVGPQTATVNHSAAAPANGQTFNASAQFNTTQTQNGCLTSFVAALVNSNWTASDPSVQLSASPATQVTATCTQTLAAPVTITATQAGGGTLTGQATLTCQ